MTKASKPKPHHAHPFRTAVIRGLAVVMPPLLTVVIFIWIGATVSQYAIDPLIDTTRSTIVYFVEDIRPAKSLPPELAEKTSFSLEGQDYTRTGDGNFVPTTVYDRVNEAGGREPMPETAVGVYHRYARLEYLRPHTAVPLFLSLFILILYALGKFMAAGVGRFFWDLVERGITALPLVRNVYNAVKQVSDFVLAQQHVEFSRVVAVEWPRKGIWTVALVTGESLQDIAAAANEPVLSVLIPTSPMPMTGFTVTVKKSETVDLDITFDQAIQFIVSCGVAAPKAAVPQLPGPPSHLSDSVRSLLADDEKEAVVGATEEE